MSVWQRLPEDEDGLDAVAASYYGNTQLLPVAGSQAAIQALPRLFATRTPAGTVACITPIYNEHPAAWRAAGHTVTLHSSLATAIEQSRIVVLCNPNNPDGRVLDRATLLAASTQLADKQGWLIVDEAFIDPQLEYSVTHAAGGECANLIVLRSLGKFFGLAGARVGFVFAQHALREDLRDLLGPWAISHPARVVTRAALADIDWQGHARNTLLAANDRLARLLHTLGENSGTALFRYLPFTQAQALHEFLAQRGILTRLFTIPAALRFGLPATEDEWQQLSTALTEWNTQ